MPHEEADARLEESAHVCDELVSLELHISFLGLVDQDIIGEALWALDLVVYLAEHVYPRLAQVFELLHVFLEVADLFSVGLDFELR